MFRSRYRPSPALVVACIALLVALTGTGVAAVSQVVPRNSVGTAQLKSNAVVSAKVKNGSLLRADFKAGQIPAGPAGPAGPTGPAGPAGPKGDKGDTGASATALWAVVTSTGGNSRSSGVNSVAKLAGEDGRYEVVFNRDVTACSYVASIGKAAANATTPGEVAVAPRQGNVNAAFVHTYDSTGTSLASDFYLAVFCPTS
jgi:hypothetical protein